jgi:hypothetical protein
MKTFSLTAVIAVFLLFCTNGIQAQSAETEHNQFELMKNSLGLWQTLVNNDTIEYWDQQQYGHGFIVNAYQVVHGKTIPQHINIYSFDPRIGKFKGFIMWQKEGFATWVGSFTTEKKYHVDFAADYNPEKVWGSFDMIFTDSTSRTHLHFVNNTKTHEEVFTRVK